MNEAIFDANLHKWYTGQEHETINIGGLDVKGQGHKRLEIDLEAGIRHHSRLLWVE